MFTQGSGQCHSLQESSPPPPRIDSIPPRPTQLVLLLACWDHGPWDTSEHGVIMCTHLSTCPPAPRAQDYVMFIFPEVTKPASGALDWSLSFLAPNPFSVTTDRKVGFVGCPSGNVHYYLVKTFRIFFEEWTSIHSVLPHRSPRITQFFLSLSPHITPGSHCLHFTLKHTYTHTHTHIHTHTHKTAAPLSKKLACSEELT